MGNYKTKQDQPKRLVDFTMFPQEETSNPRALPPTSLAHLRRRASEKKWPEARSWCERRHLNKRYVLRKKRKPDPTPARAEKRTASRYYQLKSGHALTGVYLKSVDNRPDDHNNCGTQQTRDHLFKHCSRWKDQQAQLWARVKGETKKGKRKCRVGDLLADERCSLAVLDFLRSTYVGRAAPWWRKIGAAMKRRSSGRWRRLE